MLNEHAHKHEERIPNELAVIALSSRRCRSTSQEIVECTWRRIMATVGRCGLRDEIHRMSAGDTPMFGFEEEWKSFHDRHPLFGENLPTLVKALDVAFIRTFVARDPAERVVFYLSNLCKEDFMEILLLCGNGYGIAAEKLLRGMYERAVTARYISMHPEKGGDFIDFGKINMFKLLEPIRRAHGSGLIPQDMVKELTDFHREFRRRKRTPRGFWQRLKHWVRQVLRRPELGRSTTRWSDDLTFEAMALKVDNLGKIILYGWHLPTFQIHASFQNLAARLVETADGTEFKPGAQRSEADRALTFAGLILLDVLELQQTFFHLDNLTPLVMQLNDDFQRVWGRKTYPE